MAERPTPRQKEVPPDSPNFSWLEGAAPSVSRNTETPPFTLSKVRLPGRWRKWNPDERGEDY